MAEQEEQKDTKPASPPAEAGAPAAGEAAEPKAEEPPAAKPAPEPKPADAGEAKAAEAKKAEPKPAEAKKAEPKAAKAEKAEPKAAAKAEKVEPKPAEAKKAEPKAAEAEEAPAKPAPEPTRPVPPLPPERHYVWGTGRRKKAVARVRIRPGTGKFTVNKRKSEDYFLVQRDRRAIIAPLEVTRMLRSWDIWANVRGGGFTGQAGAVVLGLARALSKAMPDVEAALRDHGLLTRDARMSERKKPGQPGARKRFQFSKR